MKSENVSDWSRSWRLPAELDLDRSAIARVIDYVLGDGSSFAADREAAEWIVSSAPTYPGWVRAGTEFVGEAVRDMLACGIRQFLDLGAGLGSTRGSVLDLTRTARENGGEVRVACVDVDPLTAAHLRICADSDVDPDTISVHQLDLYAPEHVLHPDEVWRLLDPARPVGVVLGAVVHHEPDERRIAGALRRYHDELAVGSMLAITHLSADHAPLDDLAAVVNSHALLGFPVTPRSRSELRRLLGAWEPRTWIEYQGLLGFAVVAAKTHHRKTV